ncbi:hypothetical protein BDW72DRAFT_187831 [Aspergillus terricola var. indicus]
MIGRLLSFLRLAKSSRLPLLVCCSILQLFTIIPRSAWSGCGLNRAGASFKLISKKRKKDTIKVEAFNIPSTSEHCT